MSGRVQEASNRAVSLCRDERPHPEQPKSSSVAATCWPPVETRRTGLCQPATLPERVQGLKGVPRAWWRAVTCAEKRRQTRRREGPAGVRPLGRVGYGGGARKGAEGSGRSAQECAGPDSPPNNMTESSRPVRRPCTQ